MPNRRSGQVGRQEENISDQCEVWKFTAGYYPINGSPERYLGTCKGGIARDVVHCSSRKPQAVVGPISNRMPSLALHQAHVQHHRVNHSEMFRSSIFDVLVGWDTRRAHHDTADGFPASSSYANRRLCGLIRKDMWRCTCVIPRYKLYHPCNLSLSM